MPQYSVAEKHEKTQRVVDLRAKGWSFQAIADDIGVARNTATTWHENELALRSEHRGTDKEKHLAVFDVIQKEAWEGYEGEPPGSHAKVGYLNTIKAAEDSKVKITGAEAPKKIQHVDEDFEIVFDDDDAFTEAS